MVNVNETTPKLTRPKQTTHKCRQPAFKMSTLQQCPQPHCQVSSLWSIGYKYVKKHLQCTSSDLSIKKQLSRVVIGMFCYISTIPLFSTPKFTNISIKK